MGKYQVASLVGFIVFHTMISRGFFKKDLKNKIRKRGAGWEKLKK
jgi:hypothetical protein